MLGATTTTTTIPLTNIVFSIASQASPTAPYVTAASLTDAGVTWTDPDGDTTNSKTPLASFFTSNPGEYKLWCSNWSAVSTICFAQSAARAWLTAISFAPSNYLSALTRIDFRNNTQDVDWQVDPLPSSINDIRTAWWNNSGETTCFPEVSHLTSALSMKEVWGATIVSTFPTPPVGANVFTYTYYGCTASSLPDISSYTANTKLDFTFGYCVNAVSLCNLNAHNLVTTCNQLCNGDVALLFLPVTNTLPACTTYNDAFRLCAACTSDISTWPQWRSIITDWDSYKSQIRYSTSNKMFSVGANVKDGLTIRMDDSKLTQNDVDCILVDFDTSAKSNLVINVGGATVGWSNLSASAVGDVAASNIIARGGTATWN
jgi:hypothetical protein